MWEYESPLLLCPATCRSLKLNRFHVQCRGIQMNLIKNGEVEICATNGIRTNTRYTIDLRSVQQSPPFVCLRSICANYSIFVRKMQLETRLNSFFFVHWTVFGIIVIVIMHNTNIIENEFGSNALGDPIRVRSYWKFEFYCHSK